MLFRSGQMLQILSVGLIVTRYSLVQQVYLALGQTRYFVWLNIVRLVATFTLIPLGYYLGGFFGALIAIALRNTPMVILTFYYNSKHRLNNVKLEFLTLLFLPLGYGLGTTISWLFGTVR